MKFLLSSILMLGLTMGACSCSADKSEDIYNPVPTPTPTPAGQKALVVYFSCTGTTKGVAEKIVETPGADIWEIAPAEPYTSADLNYNDESSRCCREHNNPAIRPALAENCAAVANHDVIFIGYPIWWGKAPNIIYTFLESHNLEDKTLVPFCTSASSPLGTSDTDLHNAAQKADWKAGRRFGYSTSAKTVSDWIAELGLNLQ